MRKSFVIAATAVIAAVPLAAIGVTTIVATTVLSSSAAKADTAILPGWRHPCGRQPRCFERAEARRQARLNALYMRY